METIKIMNTHTLEFLLQKNKEFVSQYQTSRLMCFIKSSKLENQVIRENLLDCIQLFSDYFQKVVMLRYIFSEEPKSLAIAQQHLAEEYGHNTLLTKDRKHRLAVWDPILDATSSWFAWKMLSLDSEEKTVLVHLVLEASAHLFFQEAHRVMKHYKETSYFEIHSEIDEAHEQMGLALLQNLSPEKYERLGKIQTQAWKMLNVVCNKIVDLSDFNAE